MAIIEKLTPSDQLALAALFAPEIEPEPESTEKSTWIADAVFMRRGGIGHLLIIKHDGGGLLFVGEGIKPWMKGLVLAGIWSGKNSRLSRGTAFHKLLRSKGFIYQDIAPESLEACRVLLNQGIKEARRVHLERERMLARVRRSEIRKREERTGERERERGERGQAGQGRTGRGERGGRGGRSAQGGRERGRGRIPYEEQMLALLSPGVRSRVLAIALGR